jgi:hypothetical protein
VFKLFYNLFVDDVRTLDEPVVVSQWVIFDDALSAVDFLDLFPVRPGRVGLERFIVFLEKF